MEKENKEHPKSIVLGGVLVVLLITYLIFPPAVFACASIAVWILVFFILFLSIIVLFNLIVEFLPDIIAGYSAVIIVILALFLFDRYVKIGEHRRQLYLQENSEYIMAKVTSSSRRVLEDVGYYAITVVFDINNTTYYCRFSSSKDAEIGSGLKVKYYPDDPRINDYGGGSGSDMSGW